MLQFQPVISITFSYEIFYIHFYGGTEFSKSDVYFTLRAYLNHTLFSLEMFDLI